MKPFAQLFPNASQSIIDANPDLSVQVKDGSRKGHSRGRMNRTEAEFAVYLEAIKRNGEILRYEYEGITLRWADMRYTPDFVVLTNAEYCGFKLIEVKGGHIWDRDIVRFKGARAYWPEFSFEMYQKTRQGWKRIH